MENVIDDVNMPEEPVRVPPEMLLAYLGESFNDNLVVLPMDGWDAIIKTVLDHGDKELMQKLNDLGVPVVPVMLEGLVKKEEESKILLPNGMPRGESRIIMP